MILRLLLARSEHRIRRKTIAKQFIRVSFDQFAVNDPGFFREHVAARVTLRRFEENVPWRTPFACVTRQLAIAKVRSLLAIVASFRFDDDGIWRASPAKEIACIISRPIFADAHYLEPLRF